MINARETVPKDIASDLLDSCKGVEHYFYPGPRWIGVPGELRGYETAHKRHGKLPWRKLFEPAIKLATEGFPVPAVLNAFLNHSMLKPFFLNTSICQVFCKDGDVLRTGDILKLPALAETLRLVAEGGADEFYKGALAQKIVDDNRRAGGTMTLDDLKNFQVDIVPALKVPLGKYTLYSSPPPAAGPILSFILNILKGYNFSPDSVKGTSAKVETYHRIIEALKFANGQKSKILDPRFANLKEDIATLISDSFADLARSRIDDSGNHTLSYYNISQPRRDGPGTSHLSVVAKDGSAVSVTSTINYVFGSTVYSPQTGIIFNNELADFCKLSTGRRISEGERPTSAMTPSILISNDKKSVMAIGGAGGDMITSATALAIINKLWFGYSLEKAISTGTVYVSRANELYSEFDVLKERKDFEDTKRGLEARGHRFLNKSFYLNVVQAVAKEGHCVYAESDKRKRSRAAGY